MKAIKQYINDNFNSDWDYVIEMASIGYPILNETNHYIALHRKNAGDRERPHIHIYLENDEVSFPYLHSQMKEIRVSRLLFPFLYVLLP